MSLIDWFILSAVMANYIKLRVACIYGITNKIHVKFKVS